MSSVHSNKLLGSRRLGYRGHPMMSRKLALKKKCIIDNPSRKPCQTRLCKFVRIRCCGTLQQATTDPWPGFNVVNYYVSLTYNNIMYDIFYVKTHVHRLSLVCVCVCVCMWCKRGCGMCIEREIKCVRTGNPGKKG